MGRSAKLGSPEKDKEGILRWNRTVNVFRRAAGMEPFPEEFPVESEETETMVHEKAEKAKEKMTAEC